ncbi:MAG: DUF4124 domain-containing protein [Ignavibacteria bacterium]
MNKSALAMLATAATVAFAQDAYRWVGKDGAVHYSDAPPPPEARQVEEKRLDASVVGGDKQPYETRRAAADFPVTLYVTPDCAQACADARSFLAARGIPFSEKSLATPEQVAAFTQATQSDTVPTLTVGTQVSKGFLDSAWNGLLDDAGYPPAR